MPELPEVETTCHSLRRAGIIGSRIQRALVLWPKTVAPLEPHIFIQRIKGCTIRGVERRAKYIRINLEKRATLLIHLRMTGRLELVPRGQELDKHQHIILGLDKDLDLRLHDTRKFGQILYTENPAGILAKLGPEPLDKTFTEESFYQRLKKHKRQLKPLLLDQAFLAGLGNIYVDESLWLAGIHPQSLSGNLSACQAGKLLKSIRQVLRQAIANLGTSLGNNDSNFSSNYGRGNNRDQLKVFRRTGQSCLRCRTVIERIVVGQRSTHICPVCQTLLA